MSLENRIIKYNFIFIAIFFLCSCSSVQKESPSQKDVTQEYVSLSKDAQAFVPESPMEDSEYAPVLLRWQRDVTLYKDLQLYFVGSAVLISSEMQSAYRKRVEKIQGVSAKLDSNIISENQDMVPVVITSYTPIYKFTEVDNDKIWNLALSYNNKWIRPSSIVYYRNKAVFQSYFPTGSVWSRMYVIQFHIPHFDESQKNIVFSMHSGIAKADYYWR